MKFKSSFVAAIVTTAALLLAAPVQARDDRVQLPIADAIAAQDKLGGDISFYWGDTAHPAVENKYGTFGTNKKTNAFNKTDKEACEWVWLSAMLALESKARSLGGDAVVNITSNYKNQPHSSTTKYECGVGKFLAGVALKGTVVKLK